MDNLSLFFLVFGLNHKSPLLDNLMIFGAEVIIYLTVILSFTVTFKGHVNEKKAFILYLISTPILLIIIKIVHSLIYLPRPFIDNNFIPLISFQSSGPSFPSIHTSLMSMIAFSYAFYKSKWTSLFIFLMLWVGLSRIYVGVHYPLDIIGGILVGIISLLFAIKIKEWLKVALLGKQLKS